MQRVNSARTPQVVGGLLDVDCDEATIKGLLASVTGNFPIDELVKEVEQRNGLKLILLWLEARVPQGSQDPVSRAIVEMLGDVFADGNVAGRVQCASEILHRLEQQSGAFLKENNVRIRIILLYLHAPDDVRHSSTSRW